MLIEIVDLFIYYWPKVLAGAWFAFFNGFIFAKYGNQRKHLIRNFIVLFFISSGFLAILAEYFFCGLYNYLIANFQLPDDKGFIFIFLSILGDSLSVFIGGNIYTKYTGNKQYLGATIYLEYVCIERLCCIIAVSPFTFFLLFILFHLILFTVQKNDLPYLFSPNNIYWKKIFLYLLGLFYVLDLLYGAVYLFPEFADSTFNVQSIVWLDLVALLNSMFVCGYLKISYSISREHDDKLTYLKKLQNSQEDIIISLAQISEAKSGETGQHIRRVAEYSMLLAQQMHMSPQEVETLHVAAMMHDVGKLMVSQEILEKPGKLTEEEYIAIKEHAKYGSELLASTDGDILNMAKIIALQHHERWDGKGYPNGLKGNKISIYAQIVSVTDVYDALTSKRSYKEAWSPAMARKEIIDQRGKQFAPLVVDAFIACYDRIEEVRLQYADNE